MPVLEWDAVGERIYETGLNQGVLYLPDGHGVPWNGLTSIVESFDKEVSPVYYDGMKINDLVILGDFAATMNAITYPDEFIELEGFGSSEQGIIYADQAPKAFGLCYKTLIGNDIEGDDLGYKLHIIYNVTAVPVNKTYASTTGELSVQEFSWNIVASPEEVPGFRPTAHIIIDSRKTNSVLLASIEDILYGTSSSVATLILMADLVDFLTNWYVVRITDNGDGTWTAEAPDGYINMITPEVFEITDVDATYLDADTFVLSDTL